MTKNWSLVLISLLIVIISGLIIYIGKITERHELSKENNYIAKDTVMQVTKSETDNEIIYKVVNNAKKLTYSWTFQKDENLKKALKDNMEIDMSLNLDILTNIENNKLTETVSNNDLLILSFEHHGSLPTTAKIKLNVEDKYNDGELLYLYYLNEDTNEIEYIDSQIPVKNGYIEFEISHCSDYFLTASIVQEAVNNPKNVNLIIIVMVIVIIVLIGATLFQNKK